MTKVRTFAGREHYEDPRHKRHRGPAKKQTRFVKLPSQSGEQSSSSPPDSSSKSEPASVSSLTGVNGGMGKMGAPCTIREAYLNGSGPGLLDGSHEVSLLQAGSRINSFQLNKVARLDEQMHDDAVHAQQALKNKSRMLGPEIDKQVAHSNMNDNSYFQPGGGVSARGHYMLNKVVGVDRQFQDDAEMLKGDPSLNFFKGVKVYVGDHTVPSKEAVRKWMAQYGGTLCDWQTPDCTHWIAERVADTHIKAAMSGRFTVVTSKWVQDSVKAQRKVDPAFYQLTCLTDKKQPNIREMFGGSRSSASVPVHAPIPIPAPPAPAPVPLAFPDTLGDDHTGLNQSPLSMQKKNRYLSPDHLSGDSEEGPDCRSSESDPNFVSTFFRHSRLHFIGSFRAYLRRFVRSVRPRIPPQRNDDEISSLVIVHVDMDCFFVSCSLRNRPELRGHPVAIAWGGNGQDANGEISSASYEARKYGVKSGMWLRQARELCPDLQVLPYEFDQYRRVSEQAYRLFFELTNRVEVSSCDEAYLDITDLVIEGFKGNPHNKSEQNRALQNRKLAVELVRDLREKVKRQTGGCTCSAGIARNKLLAKMCTDHAKRNHGPDSQFSLLLSERMSAKRQNKAKFDLGSIEEDDDDDFGNEVPGPTNASESVLIERFISSKKIKDLPGMGWRSRKKLEECCNITTIQQLLSMRESDLINSLGDRALVSRIRSMARGEGKVHLQLNMTQKSLSVQITWGVRFGTRRQTYSSSTSSLKHTSADSPVSRWVKMAPEDQVKGFLHKLVGVLCDRLALNEYVGSRVRLEVLQRKLNVKNRWGKHLGHGPCDRYHDICKLSELTADNEKIYAAVMSMFQAGKKCFVKPNMLRGVCIAMLGLRNADGKDDGATTSPGRAQGQTDITKYLESESDAKVEQARIPGNQMDMAVPKTYNFDVESDWGVEYDNEEWDEAVGSLGRRSSLGMLINEPSESHSSAPDDFHKNYNLYSSNMQGQKAVSDKQGILNQQFCSMESSNSINNEEEFVSVFQLPPRQRMALKDKHLGKRKKRSGIKFNVNTLLMGDSRRGRVKTKHVTGGAWQRYDPELWENPSKNNQYKRPRTKMNHSIDEHIKRINGTGHGLTQSKKDGHYISEDFLESYRFFEREPWMKLRGRFLDYMRSEDQISPRHIREMILFFGDMLKDRTRTDEILRALRCMRQASCFDKHCTNWRLPFYVILETVQEALATGWAGGAVRGKLNVDGIVPPLSNEERDSATVWFEAAQQAEALNENIENEVDSERNEDMVSSSDQTQITSSEESDESEADPDNLPGFTQLDDDDIPPSL